MKAPKVFSTTIYNADGRHGLVYEVYNKSEADRYIAELQSANQLEIDEWYNKLMYHKYKRCLAMAEYCASELEIAFRDPFIESGIKGCVFFRRWLNKWRELAEKFKEAK